MTEMKYKLAGNMQRNIFGNNLQTIQFRESLKPCYFMNEYYISSSCVNMCMLVSRKCRNARPSVRPCVQSSARPIVVVLRTSVRPLVCPVVFVLRPSARPVNVAYHTSDGVPKGPTQP